MDRRTVWHYLHLIPSSLWFIAFLPLKLILPTEDVSICLFIYLSIYLTWPYNMAFFRLMRGFVVDIHRASIFVIDQARDNVLLASFIG